MKDQRTSLNNRHFDKYDQDGAYHWIQCDRRSFHYNPPLEARYAVVVDEVKRFGRCDLLLDVGSGDGYLMGQLSPHVRRVAGIDTESTAVRLAQNKLAHLPNCTVYLGNGHQLPLESGEADVVLLTDVIEHLDNPDLCLAEVSRVLRPGGVLILTTPQWQPDRVWDHRHVKEFTPDELVGLLEPYFADISMRYFWPLRWSRLYHTRLGWRCIKHFARHAYNPFLRSSTERPELFGQQLAVCRTANG